MWQKVKRRWDKITSKQLIICSVILIVMGVSTIPLIGVLGSIWITRIGIILVLGALALNPAIVKKQKEEEEKEPKKN